MNAPVDELLAKLEGVIQRGPDRWVARCPAHEDRTQSLSITTGKDGNAVLHCHAGCPWEKVAEAAGAAAPRPQAAATTPRGPAKEKRPAFGKPTAVYEYTDERGQMLFQVVRDEHKNFRQRRPSHQEPPADPWIWEAPKDRRPLYQLHEVVGAVLLGVRVYVCEGEKDVETVRKLGLVATTNPGGAGKWLPEHTAALKGAREVVLLPDNDEPGMQHARGVRRALRGVARRVRVLRLPNLPEKGDVSDWVAQGGTREKLEAIAEGPPAHEGWMSAMDLVEMDIPDTDWITPGLLSVGANAIISGESGVWKSWFAWDWAISLALGGRFVQHFDCRKSRVMIVSGDEPVTETRRKLKWLIQYQAPNGSGAALKTDLHVRGGDAELSDPEVMADVADAAADFMPDVVFIDSMDATIEGDENKKEFVRNARKVVRSLRESCPAVTIVFIHHWTKPSKDRPNTPASRLRGFGGLRGFLSHHIAIERSPEGIATVTVDKSRVSKELAPFSLVPRIVEQEGMACFEYGGDASDRSGTVGATRAVLDMLRERGGKMQQKDLVNALAEKHSERQVTHAVDVLARARPPRVGVERKKGPQGNTVFIQGEGDGNNKSTQSDISDVSDRNSLPQGDL